MYSFWLKKISEVYPQGSNLHFSSIGSDNDLVPSGRQAIIWTNDDYFTDAYMCHLASTINGPWEMLL